MILIKPKKFIIFTFITLATVLICYILIFDSLILKKPTEPVRSFKSFMLKNISDRRIIIDSGSNSYHAINSRMLEKEFNLITINLADNAGYPLEYKLKRIYNLSNYGDIILLPLELSHYKYGSIPKNFYDNIFNELNSYYLYLTLIEKLKLISETPFSSFINRYLLNFRENLDEPINSQLAEYKMALKFNNGSRGDAGKSNIKITENCNKDYKNIKFEVSDTFMQNINLIKEMELNKNIKFIFVPPSFIVDTEEQSEILDNLKLYYQELFYFLDKNNIAYLTEYKSGIYKNLYMADTCMHINNEARDLRTKSLINDIKESKYYEIFNGNINDYNPKINLDKFLVIQKSVSFNKLYQFNSDNIENSFILINWYDFEKDGMWSKEEESIISIKLEDNLISKDLQLNINASTFGEQNLTKILVNETLIGSFIFSGETKIIIPKDIITNNIVNIKFLHENVKSPFEEGVNSDKRKLKLFLRTMYFSY